MKRIILILALVALVAALPAMAWSPFERDGDKPRAEISSAKHNAASQMSAHLVYADGHNIPGPPQQTYWMKPGRHTLEFAASGSCGPAASGFAAGAKFSNMEEGPGPVTVTLEAGKKYYIAGECTGERHHSWQPVVVEVTDIE